MAYHWGHSCGEIKAEINAIKQMINELKNDHKEVDGKIKEAILEHERRYHNS